MIQLSTLIEHLEKIAPLNLQESYDNCGLIVGDSNQIISGAILTLDCTEEVVQEAIDKKANLIVAHHPIVFSGIKKLNGKNYIERVVIKAIQNNIAIYAIHTNLDKIAKGVNFKIGQKLKLDRLEFLSTNDNESGSGMIGNLKNPSSEIDFLHFIKQTFAVPFIKHTALLNKPVFKIAFCGGSGSFLLNQAIEHKADVFITSDFKYHQFFDAENKIVIVDIGHYEAEICTKELIYEILSEKFPTFTLHFSEVNTNPIKYL